MQDVVLKIENLFSKAGQSHYYQYSITILFTILFCCTHFINYFLPYLERVPEVRMKDTGIRQEFNPDLCNNTSSYDIMNEAKLHTSIVYEFGIMCNKKKIYFLGLCYYVGKFIGSCISYLFIDRLGRRITIFIFTPISIALMFAFSFMKASYSKNWLYGIYVDLFLSGIVNYINVVDILIYISEMVQQTKIPYFVMAVVSGGSIAGFSSSMAFHGNKKFDWRDILMFFAGIHALVYILLLFLLIGSPMYELNMENFTEFSECLMKIAKRNGKEITLSDFTFLRPYMKKEYRRKIFEKKEVRDSQGNFKTEESSSNSASDNHERQNNNYVNSTQNAIIDKEFMNINNYNVNPPNPNPNRDVTYTSGNNQIYSENKLIYSSPNSIFVRNSSMKDVYLLSLGEDADVPVKSLFGESKMKDFTPLDLLRFNSQIKNFLCMSFIWIVTDIIRTGIDLRKKYLIDYIGKLQYSICTFCLEIFLAVVILFIYSKNNYSIQRILITASLLQFIFFVLVCFFIQRMKVTAQMTFLMLGKISCHLVYIIMYVITLEIYPIMIRTLGAGFNIGFSAFGTIVSIFLVENLEFDSLILYFLLFNFFSMVVCYGLPMKIGTLILDNPKSLKGEEDEDDVKLGDICIENAIFVKGKKEDQDEKQNKEITINNKKDLNVEKPEKMVEKKFSNISGE